MSDPDLVVNLTSSAAEHRATAAWIYENGTGPSVREFLGNAAKQITEVLAEHHGLDLTERKDEDAQRIDDIFLGVVVAGAGILSDLRTDNLMPYELEELEARVSKGCQMASMMLFLATEDPRFLPTTFRHNDDRPG